VSNYDVIKELYDRVDALLEAHVTEDSPEYKAWKLEVKRFLANVYGEKSLEYKTFVNKIPTAKIIGRNDIDYSNSCAKILKEYKAELSIYVNELEREDVMGIKQEKTNKIFIVHGRDGETKEALARLLEKQKIEPIILSEKANRGKTLIEKIESNSDVGAAIALFTKDDKGALKDDDLQPRARQNVVFETGYFMGKLGREKVVVISEEGVEMPSDLQGIVWTNKNDWRVDVLKELRDMGYLVDFNLLYD
jgi:predicted nucleotide-binding protein